MSRRLCCALTLLFLSAVSLAQAQNREISGKVLNAVTREAIPYPTISVVGGIQAAQGDARGEFRIVVPVAPVTLSARAIGYKRGAVKVPEAQSSIELALDRDVLNLEAVVVTGQATSVESRNSPTAVRNISSDQLNAVPAQSPEQALQGKVPGALINMNSGAPGGGGQMQIRGVTTILGNGQPLYVVDGVVVSNEQIQSGANSVTGAPLFMLIKAPGTLPCSACSGDCAGTAFNWSLEILRTAVGELRLSTLVACPVTTTASRLSTSRSNASSMLDCASGTLTAPRLYPIARADSVTGATGTTIRNSPRASPCAA